MLNKVKCHYCGKETDKVYKPDIDVQWIPICDDIKCMATLYIKLAEFHVSKEDRKARKPPHNTSIM